MNESSRSQMFFKTEQGLQLFKKDTSAQVFSCEYCETFKNTSEGSFSTIKF